MNKWRIYAEMSAAALVFFAAVFLGLAVGLWLDGVLGSGPLFTLVLMSLGLAGAVLNLFRSLRKINGAQ